MLNQAPSEKDQYALIAHLAKELGPSGRLGKKALQKYIFLIHEIGGVPTGYKFRFYTYGPFSPDLSGDVDVVQSLGGVRVSYDVTNNAYSIEESQNTDVIVQKGDGFLEQYGEKVKRIVEIFGGRYAKDLELTATIVFIYNKIGRKKLFDKDSLKEKVQDTKPKYGDAEISKALSELERMGFLEYPS